MLKIKVNKEIILWPIHTSDAAEIFNIVDRQRDYLGKWLPFVESTKRLEDTVGFIESIMNVADQQQELVFVIRYEGEFAGLVGFKSTDTANRKTEIGYWLNRHFQGRGIITSSVKALCAHAFNEMDIYRILIKCATGNIPSKRIPQRLGFTFEGVERAGELLSGGKFTDIEVYSLLRNDSFEIG